MRKRLSQIELDEIRTSLLEPYGLSAGGLLLAYSDYISGISDIWHNLVEESDDAATCFNVACAFSAAANLNPLKIWKMMPPGDDSELIFSDREYEFFCSDILTIVIDGAVKAVNDGPDGGYDLFHVRRFIEYEDFNALTYGQCKRYRGPVSVKELREFLGVIHTKYAEGYFFTTGQFTRSAMDLLRANFNIDHNNKCYFVDSDRHSNIAVALEGFLDAACGLDPGDISASSPLIEKLRSQLREIILEKPPPKNLQMELFT